MTVTATTPTGIAIQKLEEMLSESTVFQTETGAGSATQALNFIHYPEYREPTTQEQCHRPFAVITIPESSAETELVAGGGKNYFTLRGSLELQLIREIDDFDNLKDELIHFLNFSEGVWDHLLNYAAVDDYLAINDAPRVALMQSGEDTVAGYKAQKPYHKAVYAISWGPGV